MIEIYRTRGNRVLNRLLIKKKLGRHVQVHSARWEGDEMDTVIYSFGVGFYNTTLVARGKERGFVTSGSRRGIDATVSKLESVGYSLKLIS